MRARAITIRGAAAQEAFELMGLPGDIPSTGPRISVTVESDRVGFFASTSEAFALLSVSANPDRIVFSTAKQETGRMDTRFITEGMTYHHHERPWSAQSGPFGQATTVTPSEAGRTDLISMSQKLMRLISPHVLKSQTQLVP